ncbi:MAG: response regulator [Candidatus Omnitrophota bacterium]
MDKIRILVVDDERELAKAIQIRLNVSGYEVLTASNGVEGVKLAQETTPKLILLDVLMPEMDGLIALEKIKEDSRTKNIPVIILTAKSQSDDVSKAINLGAEDYIVKPFDYKVMLEKIKKALGYNSLMKNQKNCHFC